MNKSFLDRLKESKAIKNIINKVTASKDDYVPIDPEQIQPMGKYLYLDSDLLLQAIPKELILDVSNREIPSQYLSDARDLIKGIGVIDKLTDHFNKKVKHLKRSKVLPAGTHLPKEKVGKMPGDIVEKLISGKMDSNSIPLKLRHKIVVNNLTDDDVIKSEKSGKSLDWTNYLKTDGRVYPYTLLTTNSLSRHGFPIGFFTQVGQDIDPASIRNVYYVDPRGLETVVLQGVYFEVIKPPGHLGSGGVCGIIAPATHTLVIINNTRQEAYFINASLSKKKSQPNLLKFPKSVEDAFSVEG